MLATLPLFMPLSWWERVNRRWIRPPGGAEPDAPPPAPPTTPATWTRRLRLIAVLVLAYALVQVLMPLRHWLYPGTVHWTEQGHRFAWHMMLRTKRGSARFFVHHPALPEPVEVDPRSRLSPRQRRKMPTHPDMVLQFAHFLAKEYEREGYDGAQVRADVQVSLNGRPRQPLIDPAVDLAAVRRSLLPADWITPLYEPLPVRRLPWRPPPRSKDGQRPTTRESIDIE
jgi:hypothetical protein